jgi:outer membrane protein assembly factor BamB
LSLVRLPGTIATAILRRRVVVVAALLVFGGVPFGCRAGSAADWPHWRGPNRNDITSESSGWEQGAWPLGDPAWTRNVGRGATSPIVVEGRLYTMGWNGNRDYVYCLDAATGEELWKQSYACPKYGRRHNGDTGAYDGTTSTPSYDAATAYLYTLSTDGDLNCWDTGKNGEKVWSLNLYDAYAVKQRLFVGQGLRDYGYTTSPLVYGDWVIVEVGDDEGTLMGFDRATGKRKWASECKDPAGHSGGLVPMTVGRVPCVAVLTLHRLLVARLDWGHEGETVATYDWETDFANNIPTPAVSGDSVVLISGYNISKVVRLRVGFSGVTKLWEQKYISKVCCPVIYDDHLYFAWGKLRCLDFATGEQRWEGGRFRDDSSCLVTADGRLIAFGSRSIALVETADRSPTAYKELSLKTGVGSRQTWPHIVLANSRLYAKDREGNLFCFALRD